MDNLELQRILKQEAANQGLEGLRCRPDGTYLFDRRTRTDVPGYNPRIDNIGSNILGDFFVVVEPELAQELRQIANNATIGGNNG